MNSYGNLFYMIYNAFSLGNDPELVGFNGNYDGYSMPIPRSASLGLRFKF